MDIFSLEFATALLAIVTIDLVLAGDNAIVIALAARNVPRHLQRKAMIFGAVGAVIIRSLLTLVVVWLLQFPGLLFLGGAMLVWIAHKLLMPEPDKGDLSHIKGASTFWAAIRTIVVADMVMGMDNVLGVAGAAHGSFALVILGLLISIPILLWGSSILLTYIERHPSLVYVGAGVLAFTAAKMMSSEPMLQEALSAYPFTVPLIYITTMFGVLWSGFVANHHRLESRISARLACWKKSRLEHLSSSTHCEGESIMEKILVPIDDSHNALHAAQHVINACRKNGALEIHLLNVQHPFSKKVGRFVSHKIRDSYHQTESEKVLQPVCKLLDAANVRYNVHMEVGQKADVITDMARRLGCDLIVMATSRKDSLTRMLETSVTNRVVELTTVPVELIPGDAVSTAERFVLPAGIAGLIGLTLLAMAD
ncbi:hypothetical protein CKO18_12000 [Rhodoferax fermentans]|uniref:UspA domain-containing protein n=2 Tax=Rhodoferax fermentans TaxID=28066 RepID=A0A1T1AT09_RHOFE|nr:hypothetical protein [Rhodoferax fermentans]OOV07143.1 hypothetical protein RF819_10740 [Rhodoferax fermentans]